MSLYKKRKAFTLAEVLITLAIIGIVAALTIPVVVAKYNRKVVEVQLLKSYNTIFSALQMSEVENGPLETWEHSNQYASEFFDTYLTPYIKGSNGESKSAFLSDIGYKDGIKYADGLSYMSTDHEWPYIKLNDNSILFDGYTSSMTGMNSDGSFGKRYSISYLLEVDINGPKKPNIVGQDVFIFELPAKKGYPLKMYGEYYVDMKSKNVIVNDIPKETIISKCKDTSKGYNAKYCGAWIKLNGWKIPDDYPYL